MTGAFDEAKKQLDAKGVLTDDEIAALVVQHGEMTDDERIWLEGEIYARLNSGRVEITMEQYLEATRILDQADPGSPEYKKAEAIVNAFEAGA